MLIDHMKKVFAERSRKNPSYSLRAFSRSLNMDSSTVSAIINGKRPLTIKTAMKIVEGLQIKNGAEIQSLISTTFINEKKVDTPEYSEIEIETAEAISTWQHFAILALLETKNFNHTERAISDRLMIPIGIVLDCLSRLEKIGFIVRNKNGNWALSKKNIATPSNIPSGALREGHRQNIMKALQSLDNDPVELRDISGVTIAVSRAKLDGAKKLIMEFRRNLSQYLEDGNKDSVYRLNIQLVPLSKEKYK